MAETNDQSRHAFATRPATHAAPPLRLRLPATSANLGPGFDALGLALSLYLTIDAVLVPEGAAGFSIEATGRDSGLCARLDNNLILATYREVLQLCCVPPLRLRLHNEIPLGMGLGSSAAAIVAGVTLANHFGKLGWSRQRVLDEAAHREGHPDNVAACLMGGMTASMAMAEHGLSQILTATCGENLNWSILVAVPHNSLATEQARALLPAVYDRADAIANIQATALLVAAFSLDRPDFLQAAMRDLLHQPFRAAACPLLSKLLPLGGHAGIYGVALSGAGPSVLLIVDPAAPAEEIVGAIRSAAGDGELEILQARIAGGATHAP